MMLIDLFSSLNGLKRGLFSRLVTLFSKMWTSALFTVFLWALLGLATAKPTNISFSDNEAEEFRLENFNSTANRSIIPQPRYYPGNKNSKTYTVYLMEVNWYSAAAHCQYYGKALASVTSPADNQRLIQTLHQYGKY